MKKETISLKDKFWTFVDKKGEDDCWEWKGSLDHYGYGRLRHHSTNQGKSHRISYILHKGKIPINLYVLHKCNNRKCVNPNHLYAGTQKDNGKDTANSGIMKGENNPLSKLTDNIVLEIRKKYNKGEKKVSEFANAFDVSESIIYDLLKGKTWSHISGIIQPFKSSKKLNNKIAREIREKYNKKIPIIELMEMFGVSKSTVTDTLRGKFWKNSGGPMVNKNIPLIFKNDGPIKGKSVMLKRRKI